MIERRNHRFSRQSDASAEKPVSRSSQPVDEPENGNEGGVEPDNEEPEVSGSGSGAKKVIPALVAVVIVLIGVLAYIWMTKQKLVNELNEEKQELTQKMLDLQSDYKDLSSDYANINAQLDSSREEVNQLIERIQKTEATNRAAIRRYEKELGTLRNIMKSYIVQIDSLNTANKKLKADVASARRDLSESQKKNEELTQTVGDLSDKVAAGSVIKARGIYLEGQRKNGKKTDRARDVVTLATHLSLVENDLAPKGPMMVYVLIFDTEGNLLVNPEQPASMTKDDTEVTVSACREVDYNGAEVDIVLYLKNMGKLSKGVYTVDIQTENYKLGSAELMLR